MWEKIFIEILSLFGIIGLISCPFVFYLYDFKLGLSLVISALISLVMVWLGT